MKTLFTYLLCAFSALFIVSSVNSYAAIQTFSVAKKNLNQLYKNLDDPRTFYCNCQIDYTISKKPTPNLRSCGYKTYKQPKRAKRIEYEHIVPASWLGQQLQCWQHGGRKGCSHNKTFQVREGDMHNLVPAVGEINADRSNYRYGLLPNKKQSHYGKCPFYVSNNKPRLVEPPVYTRGFIARATLYMKERYQISLSKAQERLMQSWHKQYAPTRFECLRNKKIAAIQGNDNPYITKACKLKGL